jgi:NADH-quinone oxidoreductase subunit H
MAEYGSMFAVSGIANIMFLGGWSLGLPFEWTELLGGLIGEVPGLWIGNVINVLVFLFKGWFLVFVMMWVRWTLPRLRIDQVMMTCLKYLIPISCVLIMGVSLWALVIPRLIQAYFNWVMLALCVIGLALVIKQLIGWYSAPPASAMPGMWTGTGVPGYQGARR